MQIAAIFWLRLGQWLESKNLDVVAATCYGFAGSEGGKHGAEALLRLGKRRLAEGAMEEGLEAYREAVRHDPANAAAWCDLGAACRRSLQFEEARRCYDRSLAIDAGNLRTLTNIGELRLVQGQADVALSCFEQVLEQSPLFYEALINRVAALTKCAKLTEAEHAVRHAIEHYPDSAGLQVSLGSVMMASGKSRLGLLAIRRALEIEPGNQEARFKLMVLQGDTKALRDSLETIRRKIKQEGGSDFLQYALARALRANALFADAEATCRALLEQHPQDAGVLALLSSCVSVRGDPAQGIEYLTKALEYRPSDDMIFSNLLFESNYLPDLSAIALFKSHVEWGDRHENPLLEKQFRHLPGQEPEKRLKIGYVSGDFCDHPVGHLLEGVLGQHDRNEFEVHAFSTSGGTDEFSEILRARCVDWHSGELLSHEELAERIQAQGIDILVDLSGHTGANRLKVFALKPAPIQATWIGYFHSTGLRNIDYFITDPYTTPQQSEQFFSEIPARLPHSRFCFTPPAYAPAVSKAPADTTGYITFGSFNRIAKLVDPVIEAWSRIVSSIPGAKLMIKGRELGEAETRDRLTSKFEAFGLSADRLILRPGSGHLQMLQEYSEVDIALDPFPFNGGMTTLEALWMGVPVVALAGNSVVSRQSTSMLTNIGLAELAFADIESYVNGTVALARDSDRIRYLRSIIRPQMSRSPLCDAEQFTKDLETLYRRMWRAWCRGEKLGPEIVPGPLATRKVVSQLTHEPPVDLHLMELFQRRWQEASSHSNRDVKSDAIAAMVADRIEIVCATRLSENEFWDKAALGISLRRLAGETRLVAHIAFENRRGLPEVYNARIDSADSPDILVFIHDDVWLDDGFLVDRVIDGLKTFDVIGAAGNRRRVPNQPAWSFVDDQHTWDTPDNLSGRVAHDRHPFGTISVYGNAPAACELLDGVLLASRKSVLKAANARFDPSFDFHFYDMDFCQSAKSVGLRLGTWPISLTHQSGGAFGGPLWREKYRQYLDKWET